jgi:PDZ domain-containing protein
MRNSQPVRVFTILAAAALIAVWPQPGFAQLQTPSEAARQLEYPDDASPGGIYTIDADYAFNVLDAVYYDAQSGKLSLAGHVDGRYGGHKTPYLQHLSALLAVDKPEFTLTWTADSEARVDALFNRELTEAETDQIQAGVTNMFDSSGHVNAIGAVTLANLVLSPIAGNRLPGYLGADVDSEGGAVRVSDVAPGSPAEQAGLAVGDVIQSFDGRAPLHFTEFRRLVRFSGAGSTVAIAYAREGQVRSTRIVLSADLDQARWKDASRYDALSAMLLDAGETKMANAAYALGVFNDLQRTAAGGEALGQVLRTLDLGGIYDRLRASGSGGSPPSLQESTEFGRAICSRMDDVFQLSGHPALEAFNLTMAQSSDLGPSLHAGFSAFDRALVPKVGGFLDRLFLRPQGVQVPAEVLDAVLHVHPEMVPDYLGLPPNTLLARAMFDGDYLGKRITNSPDLKIRFPRYETQYEFEHTHPGFYRARSTVRMWTSVAKMDVVQSEDRKTLAFRDARLRFNLREQSNHDDLPPQAGGYEELLTSLFDDFEREYPTFHELREASKLAAAAAWIHQQSPGVRLPAEGMVRWQGPTKMPGLIYQYLSTPDASYRNAKITWIAEGGSSLVPFPKGDVRDIPVAPNGPVVALDAGRDPTVQIPAFYESGTFSKMLHRPVDVPMVRPLTWVAEGHKGDHALETVSIMLKQIPAAGPRCIDAQRELAQAGVLARQLAQTEKAIHVLAQRNADRAVDWAALTEELQSDRENLGKRSAAVLNSLGDKARKTMEKSNGRTSTTRLILRFFDRVHKVAEDADVDSEGEVKASYGGIAFSVIAGAVKDLITQSPDNPRRGEPTIFGTLKPGVLSIGEAKILYNMMKNVYTLDKLSLYTAVKVENMEKAQATELDSIRLKLEPFDRELSDEFDALLRDVRLNAAQCSPGN